MNDLTKVDAVSATEAILRKNREKKAEVGLTAAAASGITAKLALGLTKPKKKKSLSVKKAEAERRMSKLLDDPDVPLSPELEKQYKGARKARESISGYKKNKVKKKLRATNNANRYAYGSKTPPSADLDYYGDKSSTIKKYIQEEMADELDYMPQGVDTIGEESGGMFVKEAKPDSIYSKEITTPAKKANLMQRGGFRGEPIKDTRKRMINRFLMQESLGDYGTDTYLYRKGRNKPVTMAQELLSMPKDSGYPVPKLVKDRNLVESRMRAKGLIPEDMHMGNIGYTPGGEPKPLDLGHSTSGDYERFTGEKKLRKAIENKNVASKTNKRLYQKMAKKWAKRLPAIGAILSGIGIATAPNSAEAATDFVLDEASMGLLEPTAIGGGDLPPEILAKQKGHNAKMRLEQLKRRKALRQKKRTY